MGAQYISKKKIKVQIVSFLQNVGFYKIVGFLQIVGFFYS